MWTVQDSLSIFIFNKFGEMETLMKDLRHQIAIFSTYNKLIPDLYKKLSSVFPDEILNANMNSNLDTPGVPPEIPRLEIFIRNDVQINCSRNRFDLFTPTYNDAINILDRLKDNFLYSGISRVGLIITKFIDIDKADYKEKICNLFPTIDTINVSEFGLRINCPDNIEISGINIGFNHLQNIELGEVSGAKGYIYQQDINTKIEESGKLTDNIDHVKLLIQHSHSFFTQKRLVG